MRKGFTLVELLIAIFILQMSLMAFLSVNQSTSSKSMGAYYKFMAFSLGKEVIDYCQGMGYEWAASYIDAAAANSPFPLSSCDNGNWHNVTDYFIFSKNLKNETIDVNDAYFSECNVFERRIEFKKLNIPELSGRVFKGIRVTVQLRLQAKSRAVKFLGSEPMTFSTTVMEVVP